MEDLWAINWGQLWSANESNLKQCVNQSHGHQYHQEVSNIHKTHHIEHVEIQHGLVH